MGKNVFKASKDVDTQKNIAEVMPNLDGTEVTAKDETNLPSESEVRTRMKSLFNLKQYFKVEKRDYDKEPLNAKEFKSVRRRGAVLYVLALIFGALMMLSVINTIEKKALSKDAQYGSIPNGDLVAVQEALDQSTADGMFNIGINTKIYFTSASANGIAGIENPEKNIYNMSVGIYLNDTGELVYQSGAIKPGQYINSISLDNEGLPAGEYPAIAVFNALDARTNDILGSVSVKIDLAIEG